MATTNLDALTLSGALSVTGAITATGGVTGDVTGNVTSAANTENIGIPSFASAAITFESDGALFTIADGEIWIIHNCLVNVTTNFDCTGDDCTLQIGDGGDANGLADMVDAEMQAASVAVTGATAGWHGYAAGTRGAYMTSGGGFVYAPSGAAETIDITIGGTSPAAGAGTVYLLYTRIL